MKFFQKYFFPFFFIPLFFFSGFSFAIRYDATSSVNIITQYQGPVDNGDVTQKIIRLSINVINGGGTTPSCSGMVFNLQGNSEISIIKLYTTNQVSTFTSPVLLASVSSPGASVSFTSFNEIDDANGLHYYWLVFDATATVNSDVQIDASYVSGTYASATPVFPSNNPPGSRWTSRLYTIGNTVAEQYSSVKMAADSIAEFDYDGAADIFMELTGNYLSNAEPALTINLKNHTGPATITFRPQAGQTNKITQADMPANATFLKLTGVQKIIFDGRPGGTGINQEWTIRNISTAVPIGSTINIADGSGNNVFRYVIIEGDQTVTYPMVMFSGSVNASGNNNNTFSYCIIRDYTGTAGWPQNGIYSYGDIGKNNSNNTIDNCEFSNILYNNTGSSPINIYLYSDSWTITNNHFYLPTSFSGVTISYAVISIAAGGNYTVTGNFIGGRAKYCGGLAMTVNTSTGGEIVGILFGSSTSGTNTVSGNTIANIASATTTTTGFIYPLRAIELRGTGNFTVGSLTYGNTIGSISGTGSIVLTNNAASGSFGFVGIYNLSTGTVNIDNNEFGAITMAGTKAGCKTIMILNESASGTLNINGNIIGNTTAGNLYMDSDSPFRGISNTGASGMNCTNNTIRNLLHNVSVTANTTYGIGNEAGSLNCTGNNLSDFTITSNAAQYGIYHIGTTATVNNNAIENFSLIGNTSAFTGVYFSTASNVTCNNNIIGSTANNNISYAGNNSAVGIYKVGTGNLTVNNNTIQEFNLTNAGNSVLFRGIYHGAGVMNATGNIIRNIDNASESALQFVNAGILSQSIAGGNTISKNSISNLNATSASAINFSVVGIYASSSSGIVEKNYVSGLTNSATGANAAIYGCLSNAAWNFYNNVIILENSTSVGYVDGIDVSGTDNVNMYHNTIKLYGTASGGTGSACTYLTTTGNKTLVNNIFQNLRTGPGYYYAVQLQNTTGLTVNFNYDEVANNQNQVCYYTSDNTFVQWQTNTGAANDLNGNIILNGSGYVSTSPFAGANAGANLSATVPDDKNGITRSTTPWLGAYENGADFYWVGGAGNWNDAAHWSATSGGAGGAGIPDVYTNVYIDDNSGTSSSIAITMPAGAWYTKGFSMSGSNGKSTPIIGQGSLLPRP